MNIKQGFAYKIAPDKAKKYAVHYDIAPEKCLVVPIRLFGNEASCDIRWEDDNGEVILLEKKLFAGENLIPLNAMYDFELYALWKRHYNPASNN
jgi:hypothetical protein